MLIGSQYADNRVYRGIKHFDKKPLTSEDIHEYSDTSYMKNAYIMNNLLGYGTLNTPMILNTAEGLVLSEPSVLMIDGDISLVQSDENVPFISKDRISELGYSEGVICIIGWNQYISVATTMRNYGGVDNEVIENNLKLDNLGLQISGRYQFRWFPVIISKELYDSEIITMDINDRDINGNLLDTVTSITAISKKNNVSVFSAPDSMEYAESDLYLVPIAEYIYDTESDSILGVEATSRLQVGSSLIVGEEEPTRNLLNGTQWYNPITREFKTYIKESGGFVASASKMAFLQYQSVYTVQETIEIPQDITIPINISELTSNDILQVTYEGIVLVSGDHYSVNYEDNTLTLLEFTTAEGDHVYFTATKIVEANDITNVTATFINHMNTTASSTLEGHVKLSDNESDSDATKGVAATPKMVSSMKSNIQSDVDTKIKSTKTEFTNTLDNRDKTLTKSIEDSKLLVDSTTNVSYKLGIENGLLYIEEV